MSWLRFCSLPRGTHCEVFGLVGVVFPWVVACDFLGVVWFGGCFNFVAISWLAWGVWCLPVLYFRGVVVAFCVGFSWVFAGTLGVWIVGGLI